MNIPFQLNVHARDNVHHKGTIPTANKHVIEAIWGGCRSIEDFAKKIYDLAAANRNVIHVYEQCMVAAGTNAQRWVNFLHFLNSIREIRFYYEATGILLPQGFNYTNLDIVRAAALISEPLRSLEDKNEWYSTILANIEQWSSIIRIEPDYWCPVMAELHGLNTRNQALGSSNSIFSSSRRSRSLSRSSSSSSRRRRRSRSLSRSSSISSSRSRSSIGTSL